MAIARANADFPAPTSPPRIARSPRRKPPPMLRSRLGKPLEMLSESDAPSAIASICPSNSGSVAGLSGAAGGNDSPFVVIADYVRSRHERQACTSHPRADGESLFQGAAQPLEFQPRCGIEKAVDCRHHGRER